MTLPITFPSQYVKVNICIFLIFITSLKSYGLNIAGGWWLVILANIAYRDF